MAQKKALFLMNLVKLEVEFGIKHNIDQAARFCSQIKPTHSYSAIKQSGNHAFALKTYKTCEVWSYCKIRFIIWHFFL